MKIFNHIFNSDIGFSLRKEDDLSCNGENGEAGVSGKDYALVPGDIWLQTLKWYVKVVGYFHCLNLVVLMDLNLQYCVENATYASMHC